MNRKVLFLFAALGIGGIVAYRVVRVDFDWALFFSSLSNLNPGWLVASIILSLGTYFIRATRWRELLAPLKRVPLAQLFWATIVGFSAIYVLGRTAELARPLWLTRREQIPTSASIATIIVERFLDSLMLIAVFAWALVVIEVPQGSITLLSNLKRGGWMIGATAAIAMLVLVALRRHVDLIARFIRHIRFPGIAKLVETFAQGLSALARARSLAVVMVHSAVLWIGMALQSWFMFFGMDLDFSFGAATLVMVALAIGSIAQIPGIGGGFQVAWIFCMTTFFQIPVEQATATALLAFVLSYAPTIVIAALYMLAQGISMREFRTSIQSPRSETV
jgi:glycosyltransferase 2 family protein